MPVSALGFQIATTITALVNAALPNPGTAGIIAYSSAEAQYLRWSGTRWELVPPPMGIAQQALAQSSTVVTLANVTDLFFSMVANAIYRVEGFVTFQSAAVTTGLTLGYTSPAGALPRLNVSVPIVNTANNTALSNIFPNAALTTTASVIGTGVSAITSNHTAYIEGIVVNGATAGNFQVQFATEVAASAVSVQAASILISQRIR